MKIGYIGLGKMGKNMVLHLLEQGVEVVAWNRSKPPLDEVVAQGAIAADSIEDLISKLESPKIIWLMLPAGEVTDEFIEKVRPLLGEGDYLIDGGNSYYQDTLRRASQMGDIKFLDVGTSGGPGGARNGACLMIGGEKKDYEYLKELFEKIAAKDAFGYFGKIGAGHFSKMVHNGIEYGMMEALAEGMNILEKSDFEINLAEVLRVYNTGSVIESRLVGWAKEAIDEDPTLESYSQIIGHTGEGEWTVKTAEEMDLDVRVIKDSFVVRIESDQMGEESPDVFRNKAVSAMRNKFGHHQDAKKED